MSEQNNIDARNASFWDEMCGSWLAKSLGVTDSSPESLAKYDAWYMGYYSYLKRHIPFEAMRGRDVLEIGLGYGTVSQAIMDAGARYNGLDIARGPVCMANDRLGQSPGASGGGAVQGSILHPPFEPGSFDFIVAIGCLHHTGDLAGAIRRCHGLLRPGGELIFMVYNAYSYRRLQQARNETLRYWLRERLGYRGVMAGMDAAHRHAYDSNAAGEAAPHTDFISRKSLGYLCRDFGSFRGWIDNVDENEPPFKTMGRSRDSLLKSPWARYLGLDIYARAKKS